MIAVPLPYQQWFTERVMLRYLRCHNCSAPCTSGCTGYMSCCMSLPHMLPCDGPALLLLDVPLRVLTLKLFLQAVVQSPGYVVNVLLVCWCGCLLCDHRLWLLLQVSVRIRAL